MVPPLVTAVTCRQCGAVWYKTSSTKPNFQAESFACTRTLAAGLEESLEFHQLRSPRDQLQNRVLRRRTRRQDHESAVHLSKDCRAAEGQDDLPGNGDGTYFVL